VEVEVETRIDGIWIVFGWSGIGIGMKESRE